MLRQNFYFAMTIGLLSMAPSAWANESSTWVDVGPGHADAGASTDAPLGIARTESRVGQVNFGRGLALGFGPNGLTLSHSIGVQDNGLGVGHNFNLSIGREGTNIGHSGVVTNGQNSSVITGGNTLIHRQGPRGDSYAGGTGHSTHAWSRNQVHRFRAPPTRHIAGSWHRRFAR